MNGQRGQSVSSARTANIAFSCPIMNRVLGTCAEYGVQCVLTFERASPCFGHNNGPERLTLDFPGREAGKSTS